MLPKGPWEFSEVYLEIQTAKEWNLTPMQFYELEYDERILMIAFSAASGKMDQWNVQEADKARKDP